jgi:myogenesis-regulating glycosidase
MSHYIGKSILISLFLFAAFNLNASQPYVLSEKENEIVVKTSGYSLVLKKNPFQIKTLKGDREILVCNELFVGRQSNEYPSKAIRNWHSTGSLIEVEVETSGVPVSLFFQFEASNINIEVKTKDFVNNDKIGFRFAVESSGHWYGANVTSAQYWPLETGKFSKDPFYATSNQTSPIWLTSNGAILFADTYNTMGFDMNSVRQGIFEFHVKKTKGFNWKVIVGENIRDAYFNMINIVGKPHTVPPREYFVLPIFNTWIEFQTKVNQEDIISYVDQIKKNNFPASVFDIDDKWTSRYGDMEFDSVKFPDPGKLMLDLRTSGMKVALWVTPFIEKDAKNYQIALNNKYLIMDETGAQPYVAKWWNGYAALVDLSNPKAHEWFLGLLKNLQVKYGVDGFKLDAGDAEFLNKPFKSYGNITANQYTDLFAELGNYFEINELRVSWLTQKDGLVQRLRDKAPTWSIKDGIGSLVPHAMCQSLIGYSFLCPDMIGGGLDGGFKDKDFKGMDMEMFVRWTQASALMPMMQFSYAPWKLDEKYVAICRKYAELHTSFGNYIYDLALQTRIDGTPVVRPLFFDFPEDPKTYLISNQFMLGDRIMVAPVLEKGKVDRDIYLPDGTWSDFWSGKIYSGGQTIKYPAPIDILPVLVRIL